MIRVQLNTREWDVFNRQMTDIARYPEKYRIFSTLANMLLKTWWAETFRKEGARRGHQAWQALSPDYAAWKMGQGKAKRILQLSGDLLGSVETQESGLDYLVWGTQKFYAEYHQEGAGRLPVREMIFITAEDISEMEEFVSNFIENELRI